MGLSIDLSWSFVSSLLWVIVSLIDVYLYQRRKLNPINTTKTILLLLFQAPVTVCNTSLEMLGQLKGEKLIIILIKVVVEKILL